MQSEQLLQPTRRRTAGHEREEPVPLGLDVPHPVLVGQPAGRDRYRQHAVDAQQGIENRKIRRVLRVCAPQQIRLDQFDQRSLQPGAIAEDDFVQRTVHVGEDEPVLGRRNRRGNCGNKFRILRKVSVQDGKEAVPGPAGPLGMSLEQLLVVREGQLLLDQRPHLRLEVEHPRTEPVEGFAGQVPGGNRGCSGDGVAELRVVRDAAPRADAQDRFVAGRVIAEQPVAFVVPAAASLGQQHHQIDERLPETANDNVFLRLQLTQIDVGRVPRPDISQPRRLRRPSPTHLLSSRFPIQIPQRQHNNLSLNHHPRLKHHFVVGAEVYCALQVGLDRDRRRQ